MNHLLSLAAVACVGAAVAAHADKADDMLEGTWTVTSLTIDGVEAPADVVKKLKLTIKGDTITMKPAVNIDDRGRIEAGDPSGDVSAFKLGPPKTPAEIDLIHGEGAKRSTNKGIYLLENGTLKICLSMKADRPTEFKSKPGSEHHLVVLKQDKPK